MLISVSGLRHLPQNGETSMSTSLLYHGFEIRGYQYQATKFHSGGMTIRVAQAREKLCCPACGSSKVRIVEWFERRWRTVPIGLRETWIEMRVPKVECQECFSRRRVVVSFAPSHKQHSRTNNTAAQTAHSGLRTLRRRTAAVHDAAGCVASPGHFVGPGQ